MAREKKRGTIRSNRAGKALGDSEARAYCRDGVEERGRVERGDGRERRGVEGS